LSYWRSTLMISPPEYGGPKHIKHEIVRQVKIA